MSDRKLLTGIEGLDTLLLGGIPARCAFLAYGPPFIGKEHFLRGFAIECLNHGIPTIFITTDITSTQLRDELTQRDSKYPTYETNGLVRYIDVYSMSIGVNERDKYTEYVPSPMDLAAINLALNKAQQLVMGKHAHHLIVFDSLTTLITNTNAQTVFRFVQVMRGRAKSAGATTMFVMGAGVHPESEVQLFRGIMDGVIEFREEIKDSKLYLRLQGFGEVKSRNWVEYRMEKDSIDVTGAFEIGRIR
jgi:circadian clock protein KaiC